MVAVLIILDWVFVLMNTTNTIPCKCVTQRELAIPLRKKNEIFFSCIRIAKETSCHLYPIKTYHNLYNVHTGYFSVHNQDFCVTFDLYLCEKSRQAYKDDADAGRTCDLLNKSFASLFRKNVFASGKKVLVGNIT